MAHPTTIEDRRVDGMYGEVWHEGIYQGDILELSGRVAIERREIPVAGSDKVAFRRGRISREGSFRIGKVDSRFESVILGYAGLSVADRRNARAVGFDPFPETHFTVRLNDPDSWGVEELQLLGVKMWEIPIGYTMGDLKELEIPFTWEKEQLLQGIARPGNKGRYVPGQGGYVPWTPPPGEQTWPAAGESPVW
jgi:hypothetical protein